MAKWRPANPPDAAELWRHFQRHSGESGRAGDLIFSPNEDNYERPLAHFEVDCRKKWSRDLSQIEWERCWVLEDDGYVNGHFQLAHLHTVKASLHRATLMMGMERPYRGRGLGTEIMKEGLAWAREQSSLCWLDLHTFENNVPALTLYRRFGFKETGRRTDAFRVFGTQLTSIHMTRRI